MAGTDRLAIAAHLHVLLRRKAGRVTDTEWMVANADYALEIVRFARQRAVQDNAPELAEWAGRLEQAVHETPPEPRRPLLDTAAQAVRQRMASPPPEVPRYIGGIR
ncbi:MAG: hypothetical protein QM569_06405 [Acidovorax sp.]|uniref:hypothetical protein n=1 Tax=Acidovorax sp. TaxID=1872122 RepID=UPI0039E2A2BA